MSPKSLFASLAIGICMLGAATAEPNAALEQIDASLLERYDMVEHITADDLQARLDGHSKTILLDARTVREYRVSHLSGAIRVPPGASAQRIAELVGHQVQDADIVIYCAVGARSSRLAKRAELSLLDAGANNVANLRGGIFGWHNEQRDLVDAAGATALVHPYNRDWGRLLNRKEFASKAPRSFEDE